MFVGAFDVHELIADFMNAGRVRPWTWVELDKAVLVGLVGQTESALVECWLLKLGLFDNRFAEDVVSASRGRPSCHHA